MRVILLPVLLLLCASVAEAQVTFGTANGASGASVSSLTMTCDVGSAANRGLYLFIGQRNVGFSTVTFATTQNFTLVAEDATISSVSFHLYRLLNPTAGSHEVEITLSGLTTQLAAICVPVAGLHQTDPDDAAAIESDVSSPINILSTSGVGDVVLGGFYSERTDAGVITEAQTFVYELESLFSNVRAMAVARTPGDGSVKQMTWTATGITGGNWRAIALNLNTVAVAAARRPHKVMMFR